MRNAQALVDTANGATNPEGAFPDSCAVVTCETLGSLSGVIA